MQKIHVTRQFFRLAALRVTLSKKTKKSVFRCGLGERVYQISGLHRFSFGQEQFHKYIHTHIYTRIKATRDETLRHVYHSNFGTDLSVSCLVAFL